MCDGCWEEAGKPQIDNAKVRAAAVLVDRVYEIESVGGPLHCELDDWNLCDSWGPLWTELQERLYGEQYPPGSEGRQLFDETHKAFSELTEDERYSALALYDGFWKLKCGCHPWHGIHAVDCAEGKPEETGLEPVERRSEERGPGETRRSYKEKG